MEDECVKELGKPISSLKVAELRDELAKRALTKTGNKKELIDRLRAAIQRQSSQQSGGLSDPTQLIQQQILQQNVPQYLGPPVTTLQPNQIATAAAYQHQLNQPQLAVYTIPMNQQQYQQTIMQPLDLQQQVSAEYQQQPHVQILPAEYQQQVVIETRQQFQQATEMTEQTIFGSTTAYEGSIDLSNDAKKTAQTEKSIDTFVDQTELKQQKEPETIEDEEIIETPQATTDLSVVEQKLEVTESSSTNIESDPLSIVPEPAHIVPVEKEATDSLSEQESTEQATSEKVTHESQGPFSLKRGISTRSSDSSNKEKRRKWSSKTSNDQSQGSATSDSSQTISGGISSQKIQELIEERERNRLAATAAAAAKEADIAAKAKNSGDGGDGSDEVKTHDSTESTEATKQSRLAKKDQNDTEDAAEKSEKEVKQPEPLDQEAEEEKEPSQTLLVQNLVRPFTLTQLKEVLTKHGPMIEDKFWTDRVKSKCCVMYESAETAQLTKESLHGQKWPASNPKTLKINYIDEETFVQYQKSDDLTSLSTDAPENGGVDHVNKSITERLGDRLTDGDGDSIRKRIGDRVSGEISTKSSSIIREGDNSKPLELDDLFKKTKSIPHLFWLPLTEDQADIKREERASREKRNQEMREKARRSPPSPPPRHRSPIARRSSPRRSPPRRSPPRRSQRRSPIRRPSPPRHRPNFSHRSPRRPSPGNIRRSPGPVRRSPGPMRRSPGPMRRSPPRHRSPVYGNRSPRPLSPGWNSSPRHRSPVMIRKSPGLMRGGSPGHMRSSPPRRRLPGQIRRSPPPVRGSPSARRRSPPRRKPSPGRDSPHSSPDYSSEQRRFQRTSRLR